MTASSRVIQPRSAATMIAMTAKPEPPVPTRSSAGSIVEAGAVPREAAERMRALPKKPESLLLDEIDQRLVRQARAGLAVFRMFA